MVDARANGGGGGVDELLDGIDLLRHPGCPRGIVVHELRVLQTHANESGARIQGTCDAYVVEVTVVLGLRCRRQILGAPKCEIGNRSIDSAMMDMT